MSTASTTNQLAIISLALEAATRAAELNAIVVKAAAEGRDVSDEEVAAARGQAVAAVAKLEAAG